MKTHPMIAAVVRAMAATRNRLGLNLRETCEQLNDIIGTGAIMPNYIHIWEKGDFAPNAVAILAIQQWIADNKCADKQNKKTNKTKKK